MGGFRQKVVHHSQIGSGKGKGHGVVAVPPLNKSILHSGINGIALEETCGNLEGINDVQHRHGDRRGNVEPDSHVHVLLPAFENRRQEVNGEGDPDHRDRDVDRPFEFGVFLAGG